MKAYVSLIAKASAQYWVTLSVVSIGFFIIYYSGLLALTMLRFGEIPNYVVFHDLFHIYALIYQGTPSFIDVVTIIVDEAWFETGYKNPAYYGVATWSFMLIPPKMLLVLLMGILLGVFTVLVKYGKNKSCLLGTDKSLFAAAGVSSVFISLTSATLTWVVCCATPSWVVALAMLGMSASLSLWLEPLGSVLSFSGILLMLWIIYYQLKKISSSMPPVISAN